MRLSHLSERTLHSTLGLVLRVFPESKPDDFDYPGKWLPYSLSIKHRRMAHVRVGYWIMRDKGRPVAVTGLYETPPDRKEASWLAWTCVDPAYRGRGLGTRLLTSMILRARRSGKKFLRLYTTTGRNQKAARGLYAKCGFVETSRKKDTKHGGTILYLELRFR